MLTLPSQFTSDGFTFTQLSRTPNTAIYSQAAFGRTLAYVAAKIVVHPAQTLFNRDYPEREALPQPSAWGKDAFTCLSLSRAQSRVAQFEPQATP